MTTFYLEQLTRVDELLALADEWDLLLQQSPTNGIFLSWDWISHWWKHFGAAYHPWLVVAREKGSRRLLGVAPLMRGKQQWKGLPLAYRELSFIGSPVATPDHLDLIVADGQKAVWQALLSEIWRQRGAWELWRLISVPASSPTVAYLREKVPAQHRQERQIPCPYIVLPSDWQTFRTQLGKNQRRNIQRYDRYLAEAGAGEVVYGQLTTPQEIPNLLSQLAELHQAVQKEQGHLGAFHDPRLLPFQTEIAQRFWVQNQLRLYWLRLGEKIIAMMYCFEYNARLSFYITGYDLDWSRFGPGRQIISHALQDCIARQVQIFDFLRGDEAYKFDWTATTQTNVRMRVAGSWLGQLLTRLKGSL